jgi:hypothetical protein
LHPQPPDFQRAPPAPNKQAQLYGATAAAVAFFTFQNVRRWVKEAAAQQRQRGAAAASGW